MPKAKYMNKVIGIIGFGNMGQAIAERLKSDYQIVVFDKDGNKTKNLLDINVADNVINLVNKVDGLILAVKPQDFDTVLDEIKGYIKDRLIISIAAGITTEYIEKSLGIVRVIKAMPNINVKIGLGVTCLSKGRFASGQDLDFAENLFDYMGETLRIEEGLMNAATAISGSGPAYICEYIESKSLDPNNISAKLAQVFLNDFQRAAVSVGFSPEEAQVLVNTTFSGTINFLKKTNISPQELKKQVTSKGGTTEAALEVLHRRGSLEEAAKAAKSRAEELSKKE